jgi:hypothetical protein
MTEEEIMAAMGMSGFGFGSSKGKTVESNKKGATHLAKTTEGRKYTQFMNKRNRPKGGRKAVFNDNVHNAVRRQRARE